MDSFAQNTGRRSSRGGGYQMDGGEDVNILYNVPFVVEAEMGQCNRTVKEILKISPGSLLELDKEDGSPIDLKINGRLIARGEIVEIDGYYAVRIAELVF